MMRGVRKTAGRNDFRERVTTMKETGLGPIDGAGG